MASAQSNPSTYRMNHTMLRVKNIKDSLHFYEEVLGMSLIDKHGGDDFTLYFLAYLEPGVSVAEAKKNRATLQGIIELTHNHGSEDDASVNYKSGNEDEHKGFGHICV